MEGYTCGAIQKNQPKAENKGKSQRKAQYYKRMLLRS